MKKTLPILSLVLMLISTEMSFSQTPAQPNLSSNSPICEGGTITLHSTTIYSDSSVDYFWTGPNGVISQNSSSININPALMQDSGLYTLHVVVDGITSDTTELNVVIYPAPINPVPTSSSPVCENGNLLLFSNPPAGANYSYSWSGPNGFFSTIENPILLNVNNANEGFFNLTITDTNGCNSQGSVQGIVLDKPETPSFTASQSAICLGGDFNLNSSISYSGTVIYYIWNTPSGLDTTSTPNLIVNGATLADSGDYSLTVEVDGCVSNTSGVTTISVYDNIMTPNISSSDTVLCEGETFSLSTSTNASSYNWTGVNGFTSSSQNPTGIVGSSLTSGLYRLSVTVNGCGSADTTINITVNPLPSTPTLIASNNVCQGESIELSTSSSALNYLWLAPNGDTLITLVPNLSIGSGIYYTSGNWSLVLMNTDSCYSTASNTEMVSLLSNPTAIANNNGPICNTGIVTLLGNTSMGGTYQWYDSSFSTLLATSNTHSLSGLTTGSYTYQYILNVSGCVDTSSTVVIVDSIQQAPEISSSDTVLCEGETFSLSTSTNASSYNWNGPNGFSSNSQYPTQITGSTNTAGNYTLSVIINGCLSNDTSIMININANPNKPTINGPSSICFGDTIMLTTSSTCDSYKWIGPGGSSSSTLTNPLLTTSNSLTQIPSTDSAYLAGGWSVVCVSPEGCESIKSDSVNVNIIPVPDTAFAMSNSPVCVGENIRLASNSISIPGAIYLWGGPNGFSSALKDPVIPSAQLSDSGVYSVSIIYQGCFSSVSIPTTVVVNPIPDAPLPSSNTPICQGDTLFLYANDTGNVYNWTGPNGFASSVNNPLILNVDSTNNGFYDVTVTVDACTSPSGQTHVDIFNTSFVPVIASNIDTLCEGDILILNTSGFGIPNVLYAWYGPSGILDTTQNPTYIDSNMAIADSGNYYLRVLVGDCISLPSQIKLIDVNPIPSMPNITATTPVCEGGLIQLNTDSSANQYKWSGPNGFSSNLQNPAIINPVVLNDSGMYSLSVERGGCFSPDSSINVVVYPRPQSPLIFSNSPVCVSDSVVVFTPDIATSYEWTDPYLVTDTTASDSLIVYPASITDEGTYRLRTEINGCYSYPVTIFLEIDDSADAVAFAGDDIIVCGGSPTINLDAEANGTGYWETNSSATIITPSNVNTPVTNLQFDSIYTFIWTLTQGACGGVSSDTLVVTVPNYPEAVVDTIRINEFESVLISALANDTSSLPIDISIKTSPNYGNATLSDTQLYYVNKSFYNSDYFIYEICLKDCPNMCDTAFVKIMIDPLLNVPDIITPNSDGVNDAFIIEGIDNYPNHELFIYNRWGNEVYFSNNYQNEWTGIRNSEELPDGTYFYILTNNDTGETLLNGYITLHR